MHTMTQPDAVTIEVPAEYSYLRVLRLAVSSLAADLAFDIDEVESARAAVDELAAMLISVTELDHRLAVTIHTGIDRIEVTGSVATPRRVPPPDHMVGAVLDASTTRWGCDSTGAVASFSFSCVRGRLGAAA